MRASPPSLVSSSRPSVLMSRRPIGDHARQLVRQVSKTVGRPSGSRLVVTRPAGLWKSKSRVRSMAGSACRRPRCMSAGVTLKAGEASTRPLTLTRPAVISARHRGARRRRRAPAAWRCARLGSPPLRSARLRAGGSDRARFDGSPRGFADRPASRAAALAARPLWLVVRRHLVVCLPFGGAPYQDQRASGVSGNCRA